MEEDGSQDHNEGTDLVDNKEQVVEKEDHIMVVGTVMQEEVVVAVDFLKDLVVRQQERVRDQRMVEKEDLITGVVAVMQEETVVEVDFLKDQQVEEKEDHTVVDQVMQAETAVAVDLVRDLVAVKEMVVKESHMAEAIVVDLVDKEATDHVMEATRNGGREDKKN